MTTSPRARRIAMLAIIPLAAIALSGCSLITQVLNGGESDILSIQVGDCLNDGAVEGDISTAPVVDCAEPHDSEIYASIIMDDDEYPGDDATTDFANDACYDEFAEYVGIVWDDSMYSFSMIQPTAESWQDFGDREILCRISLYDEDGNIEQIEGSLEGIKE
jgi:hypothetical protein